MNDNSAELKLLLPTVVSSPFDFDEEIDSEANCLLISNTTFKDEFVQVDYAEAVYEDKELIEENKKLGWRGCWRIKQQ